MAKRNTAQQHLPQLLNPFLSVLFNNPTINDSPYIKYIVKRISTAPQDYILLVPDAAFLLLHNEYDSGVSYRDFCHNSDFLQSHIININTANSRSRTFTTLNSKEVAIKNDYVISTNGFKHQFKVKITDQCLYKTMAPYLPFGAQFHVFYIEEALIGIPQEKSIRRFELESSPPLSENHHTTFDDPLVPIDETTFAQLTREFPPIAFHLGEKFKNLFHTFNVKSATTTAQIKDLFANVMSKASNVFNTLPDDVYASLVKQYPDLDLHRLIYSYVEMNIYDRFWAHFVPLTKTAADTVLNESYDRLHCLSITQVGQFHSGQVHPSMVIEFENRVRKAIPEFQKLEFSNSAANKCDILMKTFQILSETSTSVLIDADTLMSLFVMVIALAKVRNIRSHLLYIKQFSFSAISLEAGYLGYVVSTFEAIVDYFSTQSNLDQLINYSAQNEQLWTLISSVSSDFNENNDLNDSSCDDASIQSVRDLLAVYEDGTNISPTCFVRSRNIEGESCLMLGVLQNNTRMFEAIMAFDRIFTLDDILEDRSANGSNLLMVALQQKNAPIIDCIADIILQAEPSEIETYCSETDVHGRTLAHFLMHRYEYIPVFGPYINWKGADKTSQTPLFSIVRCYDHTDYQNLIKCTLETVAKWYETKGKKFDHKDHIDSKGNTLIHSIRDGESLSLFLSTFSDVNINQLNVPNLTPLMQFIKYSRVSNIKEIIKDSRLDLLKTDEKYFLTAMDYVKVDRMKLTPVDVESSADAPDRTVDAESQKINKQIMEIVDSTFLSKNFPTVNGRRTGIVRAKYDAKGELCLYFNTSDNGEVQTVIHSYSDFVKLIKLLKIENEYAFINFNEVWLVKCLDVTNKSNVNHSNKLRINGLLMSLNVMLTFIMFSGKYPNNPIFWEFVSLQTPLNEMKYLRGENSSKTQPDKGIRLDPEEVGNYKTFLKYSNNELFNFRTALEKFYKMLVFLQMKTGDLNYVQSNFPSFAAESTTRTSVDESLDYIAVESLTCLSDVFGEMVKIDRKPAKDRFMEFVRLLRNSVYELSGSIEKFIVLKITKWWKLYGEIRSINNELMKIVKIEQQISTKDQPEIQSVLAKAEEVLLRIAELTGSVDASVINELSNTNSIAQVNASDLMSSNEPGLSTDSSSFFIGLLEKRRRNYCDKLISTYKDLEKEFLLLNSTIKNDYENLCVQLNDYYAFKKDFIKFHFKLLAREKLSSLSEEKYVLQKGLQDFKSSDKFNSREK